MQYFSQFQRVIFYIRRYHINGWNFYFFILSFQLYMSLFRQSNSALAIQSAWIPPSNQTLRRHLWETEVDSPNVLSSAVSGQDPALSGTTHTLPPIKHIQTFLGFTGYFIPHFSNLIVLLNEPFQKNTRLYLHSDHKFST